MYNYCSVSLARQLESAIWNLAAELKKHLIGKRGEVRLNTWHWNKYNSVLVAQKEWFMARVEDRRWEIQYTAFSSRCKSVYTENNHCSKCGKHSEQLPWQSYLLSAGHVFIMDPPWFSSHVVICKLFAAFSSKNFHHPSPFMDNYKFNI